MDPLLRERAGTTELSMIPQQPKGRKHALLIAQRPSSSPVPAWSYSGFLPVKRQFSVATVACLGARSWVCHCNRTSVNKVELKRIELYM